MTETETKAVATRDELRAQNTVSRELIVAEAIRSIGYMGEGKDLQRWTVVVPLPPKLQYLIKGASRKEGSSDFDDGGDGDGGVWISDWTASPTAEGYDRLNQVAGVRFYRPPTVHDRTGKEVPNPIHDVDYLYFRLIGQSYSEIGQMRIEVEDIEIDFRKAWQAERMKAASTLARNTQKADALKLLRDDKTGAPLLGPDGELLFTLPIKDEIKASQRLATLRNFGGRQVETIARRRLLAKLLGIRTLWRVSQSKRPDLYEVFVTVTGWRDELTYDEAWEKAKAEQKEVFGESIRERGELTADEEAQVSEGEYVDADEAAEVELPVEVVTQSSDTATPKVTPEAREAIKERAEAGVIPGVTKGMPGEKLAKAICGAVDSEVPYACTEEPGHEPDPHKAVDRKTAELLAIWPSETNT